MSTQRANSPSVLLVSDFDHTFYRSDQAYDTIRVHLMALGYKPEHVDRTHAELTQAGYSIRAHLQALGFQGDAAAIRKEVARCQRHLEQGDQFLYPGVITGLERLGKRIQVAIVTFGDAAFQIAKYAGATSLHRFVFDTRFISRKEKGEVLGDFSKHGYRRVVFLDNDTVNLQDVAEKAPGVKLVRMCWEGDGALPHRHDGRLWRVVRDFDPQVVEFMEREILT